MLVSVILERIKAIVKCFSLGLNSLEEFWLREAEIGSLSYLEKGPFFFFHSSFYLLSWELIAEQLLVGLYNSKLEKISPYFDFLKSRF